MRFVKGADVFTASGEKIGSLNRVVIDAKTRDVTDLVVDRGLFNNEKVVPMGLVDLEKEDRIMLRETNHGVDDFLDYETTPYVPIDEVGDPAGGIEMYYWYPPAGFQLPTGRGPLPGVVPDYVLRTETSISEGRIAIEQGTQVFSSDEKHIGNVEQVIADSESKTITHFVIGKDFLLKEYKLVPVSRVANVDEDKIYLSVKAPLFDRLPDYQPD